MAHDLGLRFLIAGITYLSLFFAVKAGGIIEKLLIYAPVSLWISLLTDRGRSEQALANGLVERDFIKINAELTAISIVMAGCLIVAYTIEAKDYVLILFLLTSMGLMQGPIDIFLKNGLYKARKQRTLSAYQLTVNLVILSAVFAAASVTANDNGLVLAILIAAPLGGIYLFGFHKKSLAKSKSSPTLGTIYPSGMVLKLLPAITYSLCIFLWKISRLELEIIVRCMFFAYGIIHLAIMARETRKALNGPVRSILIFSGGWITALPLILSSHAQFERITGSEILKIVLASMLTAVVFTTSLSYYERSIKQRDANGPNPS